MFRTVLSEILECYNRKANQKCITNDYDLIMTENKLGEIISKHIEKSLYIKNFLGIEQFLLNQAKAESSLFVYATRYERHISDMSVGLFQILTKTAKDIGFDGKIADLFNPETQVELAIKYLDFLYSKFSEIENTHNRLKFTFLSYNCGRGNVNKLLRELRLKEGILFQSENTLQGNWSNYNYAIQFLSDITGKNATISTNYVNKIFSHT